MDFLMLKKMHHVHHHKYLLKIIEFISKCKNLIQCSKVWDFSTPGYSQRSKNCMIDTCEPNERWTIGIAQDQSGYRYCILSLIVLNKDWRNVWPFYREVSLVHTSPVTSWKQKFVNNYWSYLKFYIIYIVISYIFSVKYFYILKWIQKSSKKKKGIDDDGCDASSL